MVITLCNNTSPNEYINKIITNETARNCELIYPLDVMTPSLRMAYDNNFNFNYAFMNIDGVTRYYYIADKIIENKTITLVLNEDVLYTWRNDILNANGLIVRSSQGNKYINDNLATVTNQTAWKFRTLGTCFETGGKNNIFIKGGK